MSTIRTILVTGGTGFIGTHCIVELVSKGFNVLAIDNGINSNIGNLNRTVA